MSSYVFIGNSTKPNQEQLNDRSLVKFPNVSKPCLESALSLGYDVWVGINRNNPEELKAELPVHLYDSHTYRSLTDFKENWIAFKNLNTLIKKENIEVIHCNTPIGGIIGRFAGKFNGVNKIIYTAHGFHFYKGAPLFNNTVLKWAEKLMARWTDVIITMNQEDYEAAQKFKLRNNGKVYYVPGVGIDTEYFANTEVNKNEKRASLGLNDSDFVLISAGDLVERKNYKVAFEAIAKTNNKNIKYLICGTGEQETELKEVTKKLQIDNQVKFLGFQTDLNELMKISDAFLFTTKQEGLPRSLMEAMASGLPCIVSEIRGNVDLMSEGKGGLLCKSDDIEAFKEAINILVNNSSLRIQMSDYNKKAIKKFNVENVKNKINKIYENELKG
ncbi:glycosyltransferase family 4 protein [Aerococcus sp. UMB7834]|uniref:glycosyltransferase family 4 protein n=1 Tax=Aerococcus sp. UMB7834 TaxID=3046342 RepID=UPI00254A959B|nr:glycosyltransferase family 4 protein [Aerococcus sp. UMB7834]MDK6805094.1 glycosyltransferase family 4 protein [Aerococcus sp. UMB7834]